MNKVYNHIKTVHTHRKEVRKMCFKCGIYWQGIVHDLSKYNPIEFIPSVKYWTGKRSPIDAEIEDKGYSLAWLHHKSHNKHHFEYWLDPVHLNQPVKMPYKYLVEMFCDRVAASKTYLKDKFTPDAPLSYMLGRPQEKDLMNNETYEYLAYLFTEYKNNGEIFVCNMIKNNIKNKNYNY